MSRDEVAIAATFDESNILVFGAVKLETEMPESNMHVIVTIPAHLLPVTVLCK